MGTYHIYLSLENPVLWARSELSGNAIRLLLFLDVNEVKEVESV